MPKDANPTAPLRRGLFLRVYYNSSLKHAFSYFIFSFCEFFCLEDKKESAVI